MCCIIHRKIDNPKIKNENLQKIIKKNPHGWGISYIENNGNLVVKKSMIMDDAITIIEELESQNKEFLFHARWATSGEKNENNCHPYVIRNGVMFHNGKFDIKLWNTKMSDTWHFANSVSKYLKKKRSLDYIVNYKFSKIVDKSRLAFMDENGLVTTFGKWHEIDGVLFSKRDWEYSYGNYNYRYNYGYKSPYSSIWGEGEDDYDYHYDYVSNYNNSIIVTKTVKDKKETSIEHFELKEEDKLETIYQQLLRFPSESAEFIYKLFSGDKKDVTNN